MTVDPAQTRTVSGCPTRHSLHRPRRGGRWLADPWHAGLRHRGGNRWDRVRLPPVLHVCAAQSALVWVLRTRLGWHVAAVLWCACGAVTFPGLGGRWIARNLRRAALDVLPAWHRALVHLDRRLPGHAARLALVPADKQ
jgi:hypothetical protein